MSTVRFLFVAGAVGFAAALLMSGCATAPPPAPAAAEVSITVHPWVKPVRLVGKTPPADRFLFVGKVSARAENVEFVDGARDAQEQLKEKAKALGADVVKIDRVSPGKKHLIILAGRAYRSLN